MDTPWLWLDDRTPPTPMRLQFRTEITLPVGTAALHLQLGAGGRYRIYLDGREVLDGPWRGDAGHVAIDDRPIAVLVGRHVLAAEVLWYGDWAPLAMVAPRPGFHCQAEAVDAQQRSLGSVVLDWRVRQDPSFGHNACDDRQWWRSMMGGMGLGEKIDLRLADPAWTTTAWDGQPPVAVPDAGALWRHGMPALEHRDLGSRAPGGESWPLTVPADHHARVFIVDVGCLTTGVPHLQVEGEAGRSLRVTYAERLETCDGRAVRPNAPAAGWLETARFNGWDEITAAGVPRTWSPMLRRTFRYLVITVLPGEAPLTITELRISEACFPAPRQATFASSDPRLDQLFVACRRTVLLGAHENLCDGPAYEDTQYAGDTVVSAQVHALCTGDTRLWEQACRQFAWTAGPGGLGSTRHPCRHPQRIPVFELFWIAAIDGLARWQDTSALCRDLAPAVRWVVEAHAARESEGLLRGGDSPDFIDWGWGHGLDGFRHPRDADGRSFLVSLQSVWCLEAAARVLDRAGEGDASAQARALAGRLRDGAHRQAWLANEGLVGDAPGHPGRSQHAQIWAILADLPLDHRGLLEAALNRPGLAPSSLYHDHWLFLAAQQVGRPAAAWPRLERCFRLLEAGFTTMPEEDGQFGWIRSECHSWSSWPALVLLEDVLGLHQVAPDRIEIRPSPRPGVTWAEGSRPWRDDVITCRWDLTSTGLRIQGRIPAGLHATLILPEKARQELAAGPFSA